MYGCGRVGIDTTGGDVLSEEVVVLAYSAFLRYIGLMLRINGQVQDVRTIAEILGLILQRIYARGRIIMPVESVSLSLAYCIVRRIVQYRMEKDVVRGNTVATVRSWYGVVEQTSCGNRLSVEDEGVTYAFMYIESNVWYGSNGQVQDTYRVTTRLSRLQRIVVSATCRSALSAEHHITAFANIFVDMYFRRRIDVQG